MGYEGHRDADYLRRSTVFVIAEFFGWLEIIRREMQFLNLGAVDSTRDLEFKFTKIRHEFATDAGADDFYIYRVEQRAIGELMISRLEAPGVGEPSHECMGLCLVRRTLT